MDKKPAGLKKKNNKKPNRLFYIFKNRGHSPCCYSDIRIRSEIFLKLLLHGLFSGFPPPRFLWNEIRTKELLRFPSFYSFLKVHLKYIFSCEFRKVFSYTEPTQAAVL